MVRRCVVAPPGMRLVELDFSGIEAVLVGYFAKSERYVRLCRLGIHDFVNCHNLRRLGEISEVPELAWSDGDLKTMFKEMKARFPLHRNAAKKTVHSGNYGITPKGLFLREPDIYGSIENAKALLTLYFDLFPELKDWQEATIEEASKSRYLNTVWGNRHWFWRAKSWRKTKDGEWAGKWGEEAERVLAMRPQSTAAGILKEAILNLKDEYREVHDRLVLPNHDALLAVCADTDEALADTFNAMRAIMERPIDRLPLPWNPSENLRIGIEGKWGYDWADMQEVH